MSPDARRVISTVLAVVAGVCAGTAGLAGYTRLQLFEERAFGLRAASALDDEAVRRVVAQRTVDALVDVAAADLLVVRPLLISALESLAGTEPFQRFFALAARDAHRAIVAGESSVILDLDRAGALLLEALRAVSPRIAEEVPPDVEPVLAGLDAGGLELGAARALNDLAGWWWLWLLAAAAAASASMAVAVDRRRAMVRLAATAAAAGAVVAALTVVAGEVLAAQAAHAADLDDADERAAVRAVWNALFGDLRTAGVLAVLSGLAVASVTAGVFTPAHLREVLQALRGALRSTRRWARALRGAVLVGLGVAALAEPLAVARVLVLGAGGLVVVLGVADVARALERRGRRRRRRSVPAARQPLLAGVGAIAVVAACVAVALVVIDVPRIGRGAIAAIAGGCNGSRALCERRLNQVVFPGTHNSFSAAQEPRWLLANQRYGIERQLEDGIRALLLDVHYGVRDERTDRVRTDLEAEGTDRNRVASRLSPEALATADRLTGRVGFGDLVGERELYLCHTLCELGAEPLDEQLAIVRRFLDRNRSEVLLLLVEPYVEPVLLEGAFRSAGLLDDLARLDRGAPLPRLGDLVAAGTRLVVFTERDGGTLPWYLPAFSFAQDTPLGATLPEHLSCERFRGDPDSPLLLVNHWIDDFPPRPSQNLRIAGRFLVERVQRCMRRRGIPGAIVAVDFYDQSGVVQAARELNARAPRGGRRP